MFRGCHIEVTEVKVFKELIKEMHNGDYDRKVLRKKLNCYNKYIIFIKNKVINT